MGNINILMESISNSQLLKEIHYILDENRLPIASKDELDSQVIELEKYLHGSEYSAINAKKNKVNIWTGVLALPILIASILLYLTKYTQLT